jgi:AcrR family transcriptional regulator
VSKGAVYQYFSSKNELFQELSGDVASKLEEMLRSSFTGSQLREAAERYMNMEFDKFARRQTLMFEALAEAPRNPALSRVLEDNYVGCHKVLMGFLDSLKEAGKLKKEIDTDEAARLLIAVRHGVLVSVLQGLDRKDAMRVWLDGFDSALSVVMP